VNVKEFKKMLAEVCDEVEDPPRLEVLHAAHRVPRLDPTVRNREGVTMDPDATLMDIFTSVRDGEAEIAAGLFEELMDWLKRGGFVPTVPRNTCLSVVYCGDFYVLMRSDAGPATLVKYSYSRVANEMLLSLKLVLQQD
jgi:hypothetical protein